VEFGHIEHVFDMAEERTIILRGGRFHGQEVAVDPSAVELWAYMNMYAQPRAVKAGGLPRSESMETYRVLPGRAEAQFTPSSDAEVKPSARPGSTRE